MRPESQTNYKRKHRSFLDAVKIITSFVRQQNSLPDNEQTSLTTLIRGEIIKDSCTWVSIWPCDIFNATYSKCIFFFQLQSELIGYDANFNCTLEELELLKLRIDLLRSLNLVSKAIKRSPACASGCGSILETSNWLHGILPCGEATAARNALYNSFGDILSTRHIHIQPCSQSS